MKKTRKNVTPYAELRFSLNSITQKVTCTVYAFMYVWRVLSAICIHSLCVPQILNAAYIIYGEWGRLFTDAYVTLLSEFHLIKIMMLAHNTPLSLIGYRLVRNSAISLCDGNLLYCTSMARSISHLHSQSVCAANTQRCLYYIR